MRSMGEVRVQVIEMVCGSRSPPHPTSPPRSYRMHTSFPPHLNGEAEKCESDSPKEGERRMSR
jgi:hypothetical protein